MTEPHPTATAVRERKQADADRLGIDQPFIDRLVETFYGKVRVDPMLSPVFAARITDWPPHLDRMKAFWGSILRAEPAFSGNPMQKHVAILAIAEAEFDRWLALFAATLAELHAHPEAQGLINARARMIAQSLLTGIRIHRDGRNPVHDRKGPSHV